MNKFRLLDLFSGIGGFSLGLERSGYFETVAFCEIEEFPRRVLKKHWPKVPCYGDIRELDGARLVRECGPIDAICGGFPCQDISTSGKGAGIGGDRSGLWKQLFRIVGEIRPRYVIVENVSALLGRGMGTVLSDLSSIGYDAEWDCVSSSEAGAPHERARLWLVAYPNEGRWGASRQSEMEDASANCFVASRQFEADIRRISYWSNEPGIPRVANGIPHVVDRGSALGNAVVPQIPEIIGRAIGEWEAKRQLVSDLTP